MLVKKLLLSLVSLAFLFASCEKEGKLAEGTLKNLTGLDGCGWVIQIANNKRLQPINLKEFEPNPVDSQKVEFSYSNANSVSICMVGQVVRLTSLNKR